MHRLRGSRLLIVLFLLSLPVITTRIYASDEIQYFSFLRSLWFDHDLKFDNEYRYFEDHYFHDRGAPAPAGFAETYLADTTPTGYRKTYATIGCAILWAPFYAVGDITARVMHASGRPVAVDGYSPPYVAAVCYGSACYGFAALLISAAIVRRWMGASLAATLAIWFGTPLFFYMYLAPVFAHACEAFSVALLLWAWLNARDRWTPRSAMLMAAAAALAAMVREQELIFVVAPAADFAWFAFRQASRGSKVPGSQGAQRSVGQLAWTAVTACVAFAVVYLPQAAAYIVVNGRLKASGEVTRKMTWTSPHFFQVLFDPQHGLFVWTPMAVLAVAGLVGLTADARIAPPGRRTTPRALALCAFALTLLNVYIAGCIESWTAAGAFGQRRFVSLTPVLVIGLAALFGWVARRTTIMKVSTAAVAILCIWWNAGLMAQFGLNTMNRLELSPIQNARVTFVTLPLDAPKLAWRYFTDRQSFYNLPKQ